MERVVSACESSILVWRRLRGTALSASQESTTSSLKPSSLPAVNAELTKAVLLNTISSVDVRSCDGAEELRCCSPFGLFLGCSLGDTSHCLRYCYFLLSFTLLTAHILQFLLATPEHYCLFTLTCFTTWDQKLSSGSLPFQTSKKDVYLLPRELHGKVATYTLLHSVWSSRSLLRNNLIYWSFTRWVSVFASGRLPLVAHRYNNIVHCLSQASHVLS